MASAPSHPDEAHEEWIGWVLVSTQFALIGTIAAEALRRLPLLRWGRGVAGAASVLGGGAFALWGAGALGGALRAHPAPAAGATLRTSGAYGWVRHPIYSGVLWACAGASVLAGTWRALGAFAALVALLQVKSRYEERLLRARFDGYEAYAARTPRFLPRRPHTGA
ncbi:MAG: isoprenylcysteine carboxylmethyltransferase family protein [Dehalococcoidia bacterium]